MTPVNVTVTIEMPTAAEMRKSRHVLLGTPLGNGETLESIVPRERAFALSLLNTTQPDPWQVLVVADCLKPGNAGPWMGNPCDNLATASSTLPLKMAYPLRDTVWNSKPPLHAVALADPWLDMLGNMAAAAFMLKRETGQDLTRHVHHCGQFFAKAYAVPPSLEAQLAPKCYTACELAFVTLLTACQYLGAATTKSRIGDGHSLTQASEAAADILARAVHARTLPFYGTEH